MKAFLTLGIIPKVEIWKEVSSNGVILRTIRGILSELKDDMRNLRTFYKVLNACLTLGIIHKVETCKEARNNGMILKT